MTGDEADGWSQTSAQRSGHHSDCSPLHLTQDAQGVNDTLLRTESLDSGEPNTDGAAEAPSSDWDQTSVQGQPKAPDGGWGWMVLFANLLVLVLTIGFPSCIGIFYKDLQAEFQASNAQTSWVPTIMIAMLHAGGKTDASM